MEYTTNAKMLLWAVDTEDASDGIPDYDGHLDLSIDSKEEIQAESAPQTPHKYPEMPEEKINWQEQIQMIHLRSHLNKLFETLKHAQYTADKTREEHKKCCYQIEQYEDERSKLCREIQTKESEGNKSAIQRLEATYKRVCKELEDEQKLERVIKDRLEQAEYELALAEVERGKYILAEDDLLRREDQLNYQKADMAVNRLQKEEILARNAVISKKKENRTRQDAVNDAERRHIQAIEEAEKSHERANKYLSKTLAKLKKRQQEEQDRYNVEMTRKMDMLLKLKNDIANNRENLRAIWARDKAAEKRKKLAEQEEINKILAEGGNPQAMLLIKKRKNEMEKKKQQFEAEQKLNRVKIVQKILREEENLKRKYQLQPYLWTDPEQEKALQVRPLKKKLPKVLLDMMAVGTEQVEKADVEQQKEIQGLDVASSDSYYTNEEYRKTLKQLALDTAKHFREMETLNKSENKGDNEVEEAQIEISEENADENLDNEIGLLEEKNLDEMDEDEEEEVEEDVPITKEPSPEVDLDVSEVEDDEESQVDLAQPEFEGLWSKETKAHQLARETGSLVSKPVKGSKMEQEILAKTLEKIREGIVITQVAAGKEFSGRPFYSKPSVIHFKDFVVGKSYKKKVILTNVSHTLNYIRFLDVTDDLKDFIKINFEPPGQMSAGMTCEMTVTFKPMINLDLKGEVCFLTQTGPFQIPLMCSTKKCDLILDTSTVDFGTSVIGETLKRSFVLTNRGALGTSFTFYKGTWREYKAPEAEYSEQQISESEQSRESLLEDITSEILIRESQFGITGDEDNFEEDINLPRDSKILSRLKSEVQGDIPSLDEANEKIESLTRDISNIEQPNAKSERASFKIEFSEGLETILETQEDQQVSENDAASGVVMIETVGKSDQELVMAPEEEVSLPCLILDELEDVSALDGLTVGPLSAGKIDPFSSVLLEIIWQPTIPGIVNSEFTFSFADPNLKPLSVHVTANAIDVPVWVERQTVDLKICMFDRLYQDTVVFNNRASTTQKLQFEVCKELRNHLELLPKSGFIQAKSQFSAQLKFIPRQSLFKEAAKFFDPETGVLEAPMTVRVTDQVIPVCFTVQAVVTTSDLEFGVCDIDFGCCTIHESVKQTITLTNKSILPQQYGFVGLPDCLEVQPNDGFGTLLPLETIELDVIFSPKTAKEYEMNLLCRTLINRDFCIPCKGVGVLTPLELSKQVIHFRATPLYDTSSCVLHVINNHTSTNEYTHPVPRIGKGEICPVGPTSFEFKVPKDAPITISPSVGTVNPGQKFQVQIRFNPILNGDDVRLEALKIHSRIQAEREEREREEAALKDKQELELQQETIIEAKPKKGAKQADVNVNNIIMSDEMAQGNEVGRINQNEFRSFENFGDELNFQNFNKSASYREQNYNMSNVLYTLHQDIFDIQECHSRISEDTSMTSVTSEHSTYERMSKKSNIRTSANEIVEPFEKESEASVEPFEKESEASFPSGQEIKGADNLPKDKTKVASRREMTNDIPLKHHQNMKHIGRNFGDSREKVKIPRFKMSTSGLTASNEDKNNNSDDVKDENAKSQRVSQVNSLTAGMSVINQDGGEDDEFAVKGKRKSFASSRASVAKAGSKMSVIQSVTSYVQEDVMPSFDPYKLSTDSPECHAAVASLIRQYKDQFQTITVPCYIACGQADSPGDLNYSIHNTLYLEVHCPAIRPPVVVISDDGQRTVDFGNVLIGQTVSKSVTVQNISDKELDLRGTLLNPAGPFHMLNALRALSPGAAHTILLTFTPHQGHIFQENLGIKTLNSTLHLTLKGCGVNPVVNLSIEDCLLDMNAVLVGEFVEKRFTIENQSPLAVSYSIKQDSLSTLRYSKAQNVPPFLRSQETQETKNCVGPQNKSGRNVFDVVPATGTLNSGETKEITVTFAPDHESDLYSDGIRIELFNQESHFFQVIGQAKSQVMFLEGCDRLLPPMKSLACYLPKQDEESTGPGGMSQPALVTVQSVMDGDRFLSGKREIYVGCVQTMGTGQKKNGEFTIDGVQTLQEKGFTVQPQKGTVEASTTKPVVFTWLPPPDYDPNSVLEHTLTLTLRSDVTELIPLIIRATIVSE